ncbi:MAG: hypothetical protein CME20_17735 [Gemmatimonadetes bacterium]|nr:hypothetical protein [Gemmatimonadota bacterium]
MHTLVSRPPTASIYCCEHGAIHLVYQNINIGMHPNEFCALNKHIQDAMRRINEGTWPCPYVSLKYSTTVVCLAIGDLEPLAEAMDEVAVAIETILDLGDLDCPKYEPSLFATTVPTNGGQLDAINNNLLLPN